MQNFCPAWDGPVSGKSALLKKAGSQRLRVYGSHRGVPPIPPLTPSLVTPLMVRPISLNSAPPSLLPPHSPHLHAPLNGARPQEHDDSTEEQLAQHNDALVGVAALCVLLVQEAKRGQKPGLDQVLPEWWCVVVGGRWLGGGNWCTPRTGTWARSGCA